MSFREIVYNWFWQFGIKIFKTGPIPKHIAIIMDGNRRYAKKKNMAKISDGHRQGYHTIRKVINACEEFGITEVTIYCFSIENFKRSQEEIDDIFNLAKEFIQEILDKNELNEAGICLRMIGNLTLPSIPNDIKTLIAKSVLSTKNNNKFFINIAFAYTSSDEITNTVENIVQSVKRSELKIEDISQDLINDSLYTRHSPDPDLLIRTSGEIRLSDFLLWQISTTCLYFSNKLWPEFSSLDLMSAIFYYQKCKKDLDLASKQLKRDTIRNSRINSYLSRLDRDYQKLLEKLSVSSAK